MAQPSSFLLGIRSGAALGESFVNARLRARGLDESVRQFDQSLSIRKKQNEITNMLNERRVKVSERKLAFDEEINKRIEDQLETAKINRMDAEGQLSRFQAEVDEVMVDSSQFGQDTISKVTDIWKRYSLGVSHAETRDRAQVKLQGAMETYKQWNAADQLSRKIAAGITGKTTPAEQAAGGMKPSDIRSIQNIREDILGDGTSGTSTEKTLGDARITVKTGEIGPFGGASGSTTLTLRQAAEFMERAGSAQTATGKAIMEALGSGNLKDDDGNLLPANEQEDARLFLESIIEPKVSSPATTASGASPPLTSPASTPVPIDKAQTMTFEEAEALPPGSFFKLPDGRFLQKLP